MKKTSNSIEFLNYAYSPVHQDIPTDTNYVQRIINPKKKKIITYGKRYIKNETKDTYENTIKLLRRKISNLYYIVNE